MLHSNGEYRHANTRTHAPGSDGGERIVICETGKNTSTSKKMCSSHFFSAFGPVVAAIPPACLLFFKHRKSEIFFPGCYRVVSNSPAKHKYNVRIHRVVSVRNEKNIIHARLIHPTAREKNIQAKKIIHTDTKYFFAMGILRAFYCFV